VAISEDVRLLDEFQRAAVAHDDGPALVLAGPGSGKTRVIVERAVRLIDDGAAKPEQLLVLTFSRKAASDLRQRLADRLRRSYASFPVTTFHGFCFSLLNRHAEAPPRIARPSERRALARLALADHGDLGFRPSNALTDEALAFCSLCDEYVGVPEHDLTPVRHRYVTLLADRGLLDYGSLQRETIRLLNERGDLRAEYVQAFRYLLVDEYQDTNVAQDRLLDLLAGEHRNVFCVADDDQSIYGFRGAELDNTLRFTERWPCAKRYELPTNYRSAREIVDLAKSVIERNVDTHLGKDLAAADDRRATLVGQTFRHAAEEADWIAREIARLRLEGTKLGEIAVLARSLKEIGPRLGYGLRSHGIPFHVPLRPPLHPTAAALLSLLELASAFPWEEPHDEQALRALASPLFGADPLELRRYQREKRTLYGALRESGEFERFFEALAIVKRQTSAGVAIWALWERLPHFRNLQKRIREEELREDMDELEAVTALSDVANDFEGDVAAFPHAFRSGELDDEDWLPTGPLPTDAVALLTVHQAKGLEWDAVFVCDLVEGRFPAHARSQHTLFDRELFSRRPLDEGERARRALEEERRLFYVAITRARSRLTLTATEEAREEAGRALSRFYLEASDYLGSPIPDDGFVSLGEALAALRRAGGGEAGWRAHVETPNANPMLPTGGLRASASRLAPLENCHLQFFYGSLLDFRDRGTTQMTLGGIFHDVLEAFHDPERAEPQTLDRLFELGEEHWSDEGMGPAPLRREGRRVLEHMLRNYYEYEIAPGLEGEVLAVEKRFAFELDASTLTGYIDRIDRLPDGDLRLVDYKTSKSAMKIEEAEQDLQLALYALACRDVPELCALGDVAELVYLYPKLVAYGKLTRRKQTIGPELADRTRERIRGMVGEIVAERFDFSPEADCMWCPFKGICPRHYGQDAPV
jgi:DNA helicase II / ATP-dependent DNA helicase PcrA